MRGATASSTAFVGASNRKVRVTLATASAVVLRHSLLVRRPLALRLIVSALMNSARTMAATTTTSTMPAGMVPALLDLTGRKNAFQLDSPSGASGAT
jgi:hypothetical protein